MSPITAMLVIASACAVKAGVFPLVTYGQTLSGHSIDHSLAAQLIPAPLVAAPAPPLVAAQPAPLFAAQTAPLVAHASPFFAPAKIASPFIAPASYFPF